MNSLRVYVFSVICIFLGLSGFVYAEDVPQKTEEHLNRSEEILLDGKKYRRSDLIADFVQAAFSDTMWNEDTGEDYHDFFSRRLYLLSKKRNSSFDGDTDALYAYRFSGKEGVLPKMGVINKWSTDQIAVSIDWPIFSTSNSTANMINKSGRTISRWSDFASNPEETYTLLEEIIQEVLPDIQKGTGLKLSFQSPFSDREKTKDYARIRIVPVGAIWQKNFFKMYKLNHRLFPYVGEYSFLKEEYAGTVNGVSFTPWQRSQVDGYLLPDENNALGSVICKVVPVIERQLLKSLISECLVRAMGLPDLVKSNDDSLLGAWNKAYDPYSKLVELDGRMAALYRYVAPGSKPSLKPVLDKAEAGEITIEERNEIIREYLNPKNNFTPNYAPKREFMSLKVEQSKEKGVTDFDRMMLKLISCKAIKPGMTRHDVISVLAWEKVCWE